MSENVQIASGVHNVVAELLGGRAELDRRIKELCQDERYCLVYG